MSKVILGLSGGVDSAVAARLLHDAGCEVLGLYLDIGLGGAKEALSAAESLNIPLRVYDVRAELEREVCAPFTDAYLRGETPNPCVLCNPRVKFRVLSDYADETGAAFIATGHYARAEGGALYRGSPQNDQSYMLCRLDRKLLPRLKMPLGALNKEQVRALAAGMGLPAAAKPDSMEICFIPDGDYAAYIERRGAVPPPGDFIYHGRVVGRHRGIHHYTVGQRRHFGVYVGHRVYVSEIRPDTNEVVLSDGDMLWAHEICIRDMNWLIDEPAAPIACGVRVRHSRTAPAPATAEVRPGGGLHIVLRGPVRAPTAGQSAALYDGGRLLGGGLITFSE